MKVPRAAKELKSAQNGMSIFVTPSSPTGGKTKSGGGPRFGGGGANPNPNFNITDSTISTASNVVHELHVSCRGTNLKRYDHEHAGTACHPMKMVSRPTL